MKKYYFTFGGWSAYPHPSAYLVVVASSLDDALECFRKKYPDRYPNCVNCSDYYDEGVIWKDVDPSAGRAASLCTSVGNEFDGEPDMGMKEFGKYQNVSVVFVPGRDVW